MVIVEALVNVLAIIGIIIAGGFIVFFLADLLLSILDPKRDEVKKEKAKSKQEAKETETMPISYAELKAKEAELERMQKELEEKSAVALAAKEANAEVAPMAAMKEVPVEALAVQSSEMADVDTVKAAEEARELNIEPNFASEPEAIVPVEEKEEVSNVVYEDKVKSEEEEYRRQRLAAIEERRQAIMREMEAEKEAEEEEEELDIENLSFEQEPEENPAENVEETSEEETKYEEELIEAAQRNEDEFEIASKEAEESNIEREKIEAEKLQIEKEKEEIENLKRQLIVEKERFEKLSKEAEEAKNVVATPIVSGQSIEELNARLALLEERLRNNEKDLKKCKKEYLPIMRVQKNLEAYQKKLRRKEALVAKQKVMLYGVNNYADIDEENAKKLAEDLDLLDGLKLSVQSCEEVIKNNEERFPILESNFKILSETNANLKADIADVQRAIEAVKAANMDSDNSEQ